MLYVPKKRWSSFFFFLLLLSFYSDNYSSENSLLLTMVLLPSCISDSAHQLCLYPGHVQYVSELDWPGSGFKVTASSQLSLQSSGRGPPSVHTHYTAWHFASSSLHQRKHKSLRIRAYRTRSLRRNYVDCFCELAVISWLRARSAQPASAMSPFLFPHPSPMVPVGKASPPEDRVSHIRIPLPPSLDLWEIFLDLTSRTTSNGPRQCVGE